MLTMNSNHWPLAPDPDVHYQPGLQCYLTETLQKGQKNIIISKSKVKYSWVLIWSTTSSQLFISMAGNLSAQLLKACLEHSARSKFIIRSISTSVTQFEFQLTDHLLFTGSEKYNPRNVHSKISVITINAYNIQ